MMPTACGADIQPDTMPRWPTGTWSEIVAVSAAVMMQNPTDAATQAAAMAHSWVCRPRATSDRREHEGADEIQGRRRPYRDACGRRARRSAGTR